MKMPLHSIQCQSWPIFAVSTCCFKLAFLFAHQQLKQRLLAPSRSSVFFFFNPQCQESPASQMTNVTTLVLWPLRHIHDILHFHIPTGITNIFMTLYPKVPRFQSSFKLTKSEVNRKSIEMCRLYFESINLIELWNVG